MISRVKGTQDFLDLRLFNFVVHTAREHFERYHFEEIATPILEHEELFKRSLGVYTDVVSKEMFTIEPHGESKDRFCLRPELTAPVVRAFLEHGIQHTPWKVFSWGPAFRYERPQKGRYRQFHQLSVEMVGSDAAAHDVQMLTMLDRLFHDVFGMNNFALAINYLGCRSDREAYRHQLKAFLNGQAGLCDTCLIRKDANIMRVFDCKNRDCERAMTQAPIMTDHLCSECDQEWRFVQEQLPLMSVSFTHVPSLVRGLDYYNKTVFEFVSDNLGAQNAFCGGGRYELATQLGAKKEVPSFGVAIGIERLMMVLEPYLDRLKLPEKPALHAIIPLDPAQQTLAMLVADTLQSAGFAVEVFLEGDSLKSMMRSANRIGATYAIVIGQDEQTNGTAMVKHMISGTQQEVKQVELINHLRG